MNGLRYSRFNYTARLPEGGWALYNFRSGHCLRLNFLTKYLFDHATEKDPRDPEIRKLKDMGFLVDYDEMKHLEQLAHLSGGRTNELGICLCPTFDCNFDCPYCFEYRRPGRMSPETKDQLIAFLEKQIKEFSPSLLTVSWFGGEPLLVPDIIESLSKRIIALCEENHVNYSPSIITNGWFFTQEIADLLERCRICNVQITLDGPTAEIHDKTRRLRGGGGTFEKIMGNLRNVRTTLPIEIRCNIQRDNSACIDGMKQALEQLERETGNKISFHWGFLDGSISVHDENYSERVGFDAEEYAGLFRGQEKQPRLRFRGSNCIAQHLNGYAVDERGFLYKCWENIGLEEEAFGHVSDYSPLGEPDARIVNLHRYLGTVWPTEDKECMDCVLLPYCLGGCPHHRLKNGVHKCTPYRYKLDDYVIQRCRYVYRDGDRKEAAENGDGP